jgi:SAM-dependent methyltransferase
MNRETTNSIRFVLEDILPPVMRDSKLYLWAARRVWGKHVDALADFRHRAPFLTPQEYEALYKAHPRVHNGTDNSEACVERICEDVIGPSICDIGCGTGHLLREIARRRPDQTFALTGVDFVVPEAFSDDGIRFVQAPIETLPFEDNAFDTVICTHVIEHILDYRHAIAELRRIARHRLIIVVPREREGLYTFNPHFNFFPYTHSFLRAAQPFAHPFECKDIGRDIYFCETRDT